MTKLVVCLPRNSKVGSLNLGKVEYYLIFFLKILISCLCFEFSVGNSFHKNLKLDHIVTIPHVVINNHELFSHTKNSLLQFSPS
jgi:hypothetical protein